MWLRLVLLALLANASLAVPALGAAAPDAAPAYTLGTVPLAEGGQLAYYVREGEGPALVLIPGSWGDFRVFDDVMKTLSPKYRVVIVELRGHGGSWPPKLDASIELFADDVLQVVDALGITRFYVGGHSIGGMVPIEVAHRRPEAVAGVIAIEGWTHYTVARDAFEGVVTQGLTPEQEAQREAARARVQCRLTQKQIDAFGSAWKKWNGYAALEKGAFPVLEVWGDRGRGPVDLKRMQIPERPGITVEWVPNASHSLLIEAPEVVAAAINKWVDGLETAR